MSDTLMLVTNGVGLEAVARVALEELNLHANHYFPILIQVSRLSERVGQIDRIADRSGAYSKFNSVERTRWSDWHLREALNHPLAAKAIPPFHLHQLQILSDEEYQQCIREDPLYGLFDPIQSNETAQELLLRNLQGNITNVEAFSEAALRELSKSWAFLKPAAIAKVLPYVDPEALVKKYKKASDLYHELGELNIEFTEAQKETLLPFLIQSSQGGHELALLGRVDAPKLLLMAASNKIPDQFIIEQDGIEEAWKDESFQDELLKLRPGVYAHFVGEKLSTEQWIFLMERGLKITDHLDLGPRTPVQLLDAYVANGGDIGSLNTAVIERHEKRLTDWFAHPNATLVLVNQTLMNPLFQRPDAYRAMKSGYLMRDYLSITPELDRILLSGILEHLPANMHHVQRILLELCSRDVSRQLPDATVVKVLLNVSRSDQGLKGIPGYILTPSRMHALLEQDPFLLKEYPKVVTPKMREIASRHCWKPAGLEAPVLTAQNETTEFSF